MLTPLFCLLCFTCVCCCQAARLVYEMRHKWQNLFLKRMRFPTKPWSQQDEAVIHAVVSVCFIPSTVPSRSFPTRCQHLSTWRALCRSLQQRSMLQACSSRQALASDPGPWQWKKTVLLQRAPPIYQPLPRTAHRYQTSIRYSPTRSYLDITKRYKSFCLVWSIRY